MRLHFLISLGTLLALVDISSGQAQPQPASAPASGSEAPSAVAHLYVFNDSGRTLIPSDQVVTDNGKKLVSLPRQTYVKLELPPGPHLLKPDPSVFKQQVLLNAVPGNRYFVVVAYKPERSWAAPFAGAPLVLREITEDEAAPLLKEMQQK